MKNIELKNIKEATSPSEFKRGLEYYEKNHVLQWGFNPKEKGKFSIVKGKELYKQEITLYDYDIDGECSCPMTYNCKHVAAVLIAIYYDRVNNETPSVSSALSYESINWLNTLDNSLSKKKITKKIKSFLICNTIIHFTWSVSIEG